MEFKRDDKMEQQHSTYSKDSDGFSPLLSPSSTLSGSSPPLMTNDKGQQVAIKQESSDHHRRVTKKATRKNPPSTANKKVARSRFGCENCKTKRIKCDEEKPGCQRCKAKGIKCTYKIVLQFRADLENKGKKFGREGVWLKKKSQDTTTELELKSKASYYLNLRHSDRLMFVNVKYQDMEPLHGSHIHLQPSIAPSMIPHDVFQSLSNDPPVMSFALNYYIDFIAPIFNPIDLGSSPYINETVLSLNNVKIEKGLNLSSLVQYSQSHNDVFYLILSLGSIYLSKFNGSAEGMDGTNWSTRAKRFQKLGVVHIRDKLVNMKHDTNLLLSMVLLIMYEVADNCNENWSTYLKLCRRLRNSRFFKKPTSNLEASLLTFCLDFLNYQESMGRTVCKDKNSFFTTADEVEDHQDHTRVISWMGCERGLVDVISDITDLSFERRGGAMTDINYCILCDNIRRKLDMLKFNIDYDELFIELGTFQEDDESRADEGGIDVEHSHLMLMDPSVNVEQICFILACEIKSCSAGLYMDCCLLNKSPEDAQVQSEIRRLVKMLKFIILENDFKWCSTLLWTVFIIGVEISIHNRDSEELRYLVLQFLDKLEVYSLGNVNKAREVVINVWKKRDLDNADDNSFGSPVMTVTDQHKNSNAVKTPTATTTITATISSGSHSNEQATDLKTFIGFTNDWERYVFDDKLKLSLA